MRRHNRTPDREYLDFIRSLPCVICLANAEALSTEDDVQLAGARGWSRAQKSPTEAAHVGERGLMQKCSDRETVPLCAVEHHREGRESAHRLGKNFWAHHGLNKDAVIAALRAKFESKAEVISC